MTTDADRAQEVVDALTDEAITKVPNVAVKAMILAIRTARPEFVLSENNEERLAQIGLAAGLAALPPDRSMVDG